MKWGILAIGLIFSIPTPSVAKDAQQPAPSRSIFGMEMDQPIPYVRCTDAYSTKAVCSEPLKISVPRPWDEVFVRFPTDQIPEIMASYVMSAKTVEGKIVGFSFETMGFRDQDRTIEMLSQKFGKPTTVEYEDMTTLTGGAFKAAFATWRFSDLSVTFNSLGYGTKAGRVEIYSPEGEALKRQQDEAEKSKRVPL